MLNEMMHRPVVKPELVEYMRSSQRRFPGDLGELENTANELGIPIIPHETAVFLDFIVGLTQPKNILEIGTAVGFSASLMATASPQAKVTTIDRYELMYSRAKANFERLGWPTVSHNWKAMRQIFYQLWNKGNTTSYLWIAPKPNTSSSSPIVWTHLKSVAC